MIKIKVSIFTSSEINIVFFYKSDIYLFVFYFFSRMVNLSISKLRMVILYITSSVKSVRVINTLFLDV